MMTERVLGKAYYDILLAAQTGKFVLLSDDQLFRGIAAAKFSAPGAWTQAFLMWAHEQQWLAFPDYVRCVVLLARWRYTFTSVSTNVLNTVAESNEESTLEQFAALTSQLDLSRNDMRSLVRIVVPFLGNLWASNHGLEMRERLTYVLLNGIAPAHAPQCHEFFRLVIGNAQRMRVPPSALNAIAGWMRGHFVLLSFEEYLEAHRRKNSDPQGGEPSNSPDDPAGNASSAGHEEDPLRQDAPPDSRVA
jgi:hypothetical protein